MAHDENQKWNQSSPASETPAAQAVLELIEDANFQRELIEWLRLQGIKDAEWAKDLSQDALLAMFLNRHQLRVADSKRAWGRKIAINLLKRRAKSQGRELSGQGVGDAPVDGQPSLLQECGHKGPQQNAETRETVTVVRKELRSLKENLRIAMRLKMDGHTIEKIAELMDTPVATVISWLRQANEQLENKLRHYWGEGLPGDRKE